MIANAQNPSILCDGGDAAAELSVVLEALGFPHPLFVTDSTMVELDQAGRATDVLSAKGICGSPFSETKAESSETSIPHRVDAVDGRDYDELIAIGDRKAVDSAKAREIPVCFGGRIREQPAHREVGRDAWSLEAIPKRAGTDMKCTGCTVITTSELSGNA